MFCTALQVVFLWIIHLRDPHFNAVNKGQKITKENIRRIRPGYGLKPKYYDEVIGKIVNMDVKLADAVTLEVLLDE